MNSPLDPDSRRSRAPKTIGLWGAPGSGKTTFLAALFTAVTQSPLDMNIFGVDDQSTDFMIQNSHKLSTERRFPAATEAVASYSWTMNVVPGSDVPPGSLDADPLKFTLDLQDAPGRLYSSQPGTQSSLIDLSDGSTSGQDDRAAEEMMEHLAECDGLLLLIDPVREHKEGNSNEFFHGTLLRIAQRRLLSRSAGAKLPHHVAVCITKFDHPLVYDFARKHNYRTFRDDDTYRFPRVHSEDAEDFFREFGQHASLGNADAICNSVARFFEPERVRYFVTSAIGFYSASTRFREDERDNAVEQSDGTLTIRGLIHPINVLEPILWLGRSVSRGQ